MSEWIWYIRAHGIKDLEGIRKVVRPSIQPTHVEYLEWRQERALLENTEDLLRALILLFCDKPANFGEAGLSVTCFFLLRGEACTWADEPQHASNQQKFSVTSKRCRANHGFHPRC